MMWYFLSTHKDPAKKTNKMRKKKKKVQMTWEKKTWKLPLHIPPGHETTYLSGDYEWWKNMVIICFMLLF